MRSCILIFSIMAAGCFSAGGLIEDKSLEGVPFVYSPHGHSRGVDRDNYRTTERHTTNLARLSAKIDEAQKELDTANSGARARLVKLYTKRGIEYWAAEQLELAVADYTKALELDSSAWEPLFHRWRAYEEMGARAEAEADRTLGLLLNPSVFELKYSLTYGVI